MTGRPGRPGRPRTGMSLAATRPEEHRGGRVPRLIRTIASLTIALAGTFAATAASAGDNGSAAPAEAPANPPSSAPAQPAGSAPPGTPAQPQPQTGAPPSQGTPALVLDTQDYEGLLGKSVRAANGDDLGRIIDVIIDRDGRPRAAIIDFGGFLGVGSRKIAVDWRVLKFSAEGKAGRLTLALNRNQVRVSPEYKTGEPIVVLGAASPGAPVPEAEPAAPAASPAPAPQEKAPEKPEKTPER